MNKLRQFKFYVKLFKYIFMIVEIKFLKYIVSRNDIRINLNRIMFIYFWLVSITLREFQVFLDFVNLYRRFIFKYVKIILSLIELLKKSKKKKQVRTFVMNEIVLIVFRNFIKVFITTSMLIHFDSRLKIKVKINIFKFVMIVILTQLILTKNKIDAIA